MSRRPSSHPQGRSSHVRLPPRHRLPPYVFEQVNRLKAAARNAGADIIDLGMGNPDLPAPKHVVDKLVETASKPRVDRYSSSKGIAGLRRAQASYYGRRFGVKLDPDRQVVATLGSKEGFANMAQAITGPGDVVLVPNPSYPIHAFGFLMAGGVIRSVPAEPTPGLFRRARARGGAFHPQAARRGGVLPVEPHRHGGVPRLLPGPRRLRQEARDLRPVGPRLFRGLFRRRAAPSVLQVPGAMDVAWNSPPCPRPSRCRAGAWASRSATSGCWPR